MPLISPMRATRSTNLVLLDFITLFLKSTNYDASDHAMLFYVSATFLLDPNSLA